MTAPAATLVEAARHGELGRVRELLAEPGAPLDEALSSALINRHHEIARLLLHHGANPDSVFFGDVLERHIRCLTCGLAGLAGDLYGSYPGYDTDWACAVCGRFACVCEFTRP